VAGRHAAHPPGSSAVARAGHARATAAP
jgi:hypothetical protein